MMMLHWSVPTSVFKLDLDPVLLNELRDVKSVMHANKDAMVDYRSLVIGEMSKKLTGQKLSDLEADIKLLIKNLLSIGAELSLAKELRDFFNDLIDKIGTKLYNMDFAQSEVEQFFAALISSIEKLAENSKALRRNYKQTWIRFLTVVGFCLNKMYPKLIQLI